MQANPFHQTVPIPKFPSLINLRHPPPTSSLTLKPPRAISNSKPNDIDSCTTVPLTAPNTVDDSVAAFSDYQVLFVSQRSETPEPVALRVVEGAVPPEFPSGTYYLTGPGILRDDHGSTVHPLEGHGYLRAFRFDRSDEVDDVRVNFMAKYVKTEAQVEEYDPETDTWRFTHRGVFSVLKGGRKFGNTKVMKNVANTCVLSWGGKLLCLWEGGDPYEIESGTLDTVGKVRLTDGFNSVAEERIGACGVLDVATWLLKPILHGVYKMPEKRLMAHYKIDSRKNRLLMVSCNTEDILLPRSTFTFCEFDSNFKEVGKQEFTLPEHLMIHDWGFTESHYIIFSNRIKLDAVGVLTAICGTTPMVTALSVNPNKDTLSIYLLPRFPNEMNDTRNWRVPIETFAQYWLLHAANVYENLDEDGNSEIQIHASVCPYEWFHYTKLFGYDWQSDKLDPSTMNRNGSQTKLHLIRVAISLDANGMCQRCDVEPLNQQFNKPSDFPVINPAFFGSKNKYIYAAASSGSRSAFPNFPFDMVVKHNASTKSVHTWFVGNRRFIGEPTFIPKGSEEDDGYILVVEYAVAIHMCYLVILDSKKIGATDAFVARLEVPKHLNFPLGFHGFWADDE